MKKYLLKLFFLLVFFTFLSCSSTKSTFSIKGGYLDLSCFSDLHKTSIRLDGEWEVYKGKLLNSDEIDRISSSEKEYAKVPGKIIKANEYATYKLTIKLPSYIESRDFALSFKKIPTASKIFINNKLEIRNGLPDVMKKKSLIGMKSNIIRLPPYRNYITIVVQASNYHLSSGGILNSVTLAKYHNLVLKQNIFNVAFFFMMGGMFLVIFRNFLLGFLLVKKDENVSIILIFLSFSIFLRAMVVENYFFDIIPMLSKVSIKLDFIADYLTISFFLMYVNFLYPKDFNSIVTKIVFVINMLAIILVVFFDVLYSSYFFLVYQYFVLALIVYIFQRIYLVFIRKREGINILLGGIIVLLLTAAHDILHFMGVIDIFYISHFGTYVFLLFQMALFNKRFSNAYHELEFVSSNLEKLVSEKTTDLHDAMKKLKEAALNDMMTGLKNRRFFYEVTYPESEVFSGIRAFEKENEELRKYNATKKIYGVLMLDIDHFKKVNDELGHEAGDQILKQFSMIITKAIRKTDFAIRWGGEEFLIILKDIEVKNIKNIALKISEQVKRYDFMYSTDDPSKTIKKTVSLGYAPFPFFDEKPDFINLESTIMLADLGLYYSKENGRSMCVGISSTGKLPKKNQLEDLTTDLAFGLNNDFINIETFKV